MNSQYIEASPAQFKELKATGNYVTIDVRLESEYEEGLIPDHILIDFYGEDFEGELKKLDRNLDYLVYCRRGRRSGITCGLMRELGFTGALYNLAGGIQEWNKAFGKETYNEQALAAS